MVSYIHGFAVRFIAKLETGVGKSEVGLSEGGGGGVGVTLILCLGAGESRCSSWEMVRRQLALHGRGGGEGDCGTYFRQHRGHILPFRWGMCHVNVHKPHGEYLVQIHEVLFFSSVIVNNFFKCFFFKCEVIILKSFSVDFFFVFRFTRFKIFQVPGRGARFMFQLSWPKTGMFRLFWQSLGMFRRSRPYFDLFPLSRPNFGIFQFSQLNKKNCSTFFDPMQTF